MAWAFLFVAGILEVVWAFAMKQSDGFTRLIPTTTMIVATVVRAMIIALLLMRTALWATLRAVVLMLLTRAIVFMAATLIRWRRLHQRAGAEHQYAQSGDQTIRDFHVARS